MPRPEEVCEFLGHLDERLFLLGAHLTARLDLLSGDTTRRVCRNGAEAGGVESTRGQVGALRRRVGMIVAIKCRMAFLLPDRSPGEAHGRDDGAELLGPVDDAT